LPNKEKFEQNFSLAASKPKWYFRKKKIEKTSQSGKKKLLQVTSFS
jgi:hypothetical protein